MIWVSFGAYATQVPNIDDIARWLGPKKQATNIDGDTIHERDDEKETQLQADIPVKEMPKATVFQVRSVV
jgi:hypothetical protein